MSAAPAEGNTDWSATVATRSEGACWMASSGSVTKYAMLTRRYRPITSDPNALILKYEDVVFRKREMIAAILKHFRWECGPHAITKLLDKVKSDVAEFAKVEQDARFEGRQVVMVLAPR